MIESKELRLENEVLYCGENRKVTMIDWATVQLEDCEGYISVTDLDPIPLTEEVLIACGFEKGIRKDRDGDEFTVYYKGFDIHATTDGVFAFAVYIKGDGSFKGGYTIDTLHQLQNLYFSLNGEELTYNPQGYDRP